MFNGSSPTNYIALNKIDPSKLHNKKNINTPLILNEFISQ